MQFHKPISYSQTKTKTSLYLNSIDEKSKQFVAPDLFQSTFWICFAALVLFLKWPAGSCWDGDNLTQLEKKVL